MSATTQEGSLLEKAAWDDALHELATSFLEKYEQMPTRAKASEISNTQLSSMQSHVGGAGAEGLRRLAKHQLNRIAKNRQTHNKENPGKEFKGNKYEAFWKLLNEYLTEQMPTLTSSLDAVQQDAAYQLFAQRIAAIFRYQEQLAKN